jgi:hypothetical protein
MTHKLSPADRTSYLEPEEVVRRLRQEFEVVDLDPDQGREHVQGMVRRLLKMESGGAVGMDVHIDRLQKARDGTVMVIIADDDRSPDGRLKFAVIPGEPIIVGYWSGRHQRLAEPLLKRCSQVLGYSVGLA